MPSAQHAGSGFHKHFNMTGRQFMDFMDPVLSVVTKRFELDVIKLDDWLHAQGYMEEEHGSMRDYIGLVYGKGAVRFIEGLLRRRLAETGSGAQKGEGA